MKKRMLLCILFIGICACLVGCQDTKKQEEIDKIGNLINGG